VEKVFQTNVAIHLAPHAIGNAVDDLRAVLRRIDVNPERSLAKRKIDNADDLACDFRGVGIGGFQAGKGERNGWCRAERGRDFGLDTHALTRAPGRWCSKVGSINAIGDHGVGCASGERSQQRAIIGSRPIPGAVRSAHP
jgi:hypothetical protein